MEFIISKSNIDPSVNFIADMPVGKLEARYVRRDEDYFITYLSSQTGCAQQCAMCHLTATNQRKFQDTTIDEFVAQATEVFDYYDTQPAANLVHFNYMARGEPLANNVFLESHVEILTKLNAIAASRDLASRHIVSTILPAEIFNTKTLNDIYL